MNKLNVLVPTVETVRAVEVGTKALDCFGRFSEVVHVSFRGTDVKGREYVWFYTKFGTNASISGSYKVGELVRTTPLYQTFTQAQLDDIEREAKEED